MGRQPSRSIFRIVIQEQHLYTFSPLKIRCMKTRPSVWLAMLCPIAFICVCLSCQKSVDKGSATSTSSSDSSALFSATIGGTGWSADSVIAVLVRDDDGGKIMTLRGFSADTQIVVLLQDTSVTTATDSSLGVHEYAVGSVWPGAEFSYLSDPIRIHRDSVWQNNGVAQSGEATVTA